MMHVSSSGWHACVAWARMRELACAWTGAAMLHSLLLRVFKANLPAEAMLRSLVAELSKAESLRNGD